VSRITRETNISVSDGPAIAIADYVDVEAFDTISVVVPKNSVATTVNVHPGAAGDIKALVIVEDDELYTDLSFTVDEVATEFELTGPLDLFQPELIELMGGAVNELIFTNANVTVDRNVTILVGRTAIES
jgi:hypothetical protein